MDSVHNMTEQIPDWMRCINCRARATRGTITHYPTCPEYQPARTAVRVSRPIDAWSAITARLTPARRRDRYVCPSCGDERHGGLKIEIGATGNVLVWCFGCCVPGQDNRAQQSEILAAIGEDWGSLRSPSRTPAGSLRSPTGQQGAS